MILQKSGSYVPVFAWAGVSYFAALGLVHWASPKLQPVKL